MNEATVEILPAPDPGDSYTAANFLVVETVKNKRGEAVSTIDHVKSGEGLAGWKVVPLCRGDALSHPEALEWAKAYAVANSIPVIYVRDDAARGADITPAQ